MSDEKATRRCPQCHLHRPLDDDGNFKAHGCSPQRPLSERDLLEQDLRQKYLRPNVSDEVALKVFRKAWEDGHSAGNHEVEMHYDDLSEIVNAAFKAGQAEVKERAAAMLEARASGGTAYLAAARDVRGLI